MYTIAFMMTLGDVVSQQAIEKKGSNHDFARSFRMTLYGALIGGPVIGTWFGFINNAIKIKNKFAGKEKTLVVVILCHFTNSTPILYLATIVRVGIDQAVFSPTILAVFMGGISILEGRSVSEIKEKFQKSYVNGLMNSYCYWPFVNLFTFALIPVHYRPIVNSGFGIAWNAYLSHLNQKSLHALKLSSASATASNTINTPTLSTSSS